MPLPILAQACARMSQVETYRICVSMGSTPTTVLYSWNTCFGDLRSLASLAYRRGVRGISGAGSPTPEDEDNIMAALKQSDRIGSISLTVTSSLREKLFAIEGPLSQLEYLVVLSQVQVGMRLTLPSTFRWCTRLRSLHFTRVISPHSPQLLYSSRKLVDLRLHEVAYLPLEALANALSQMTQLRALSLHFLPNASLVPSSSGERVFLPSLAP
ncbi:hypothetical protein EDB84DRAFT_220520 [Lactarius hengduanensis]|nr:hypothetical protein EDB84DRAFT_1579253 [Lactarius hengduanensis]KAH9030005.1 hypothetical protein EDB84DRAFT_220520 [Lactarius hengduanensis]